MSFVRTLLLPKKILTAAWVMVATLWVAIAVEHFTEVQTLPFVKTVFFYLLLDYVWTSLSREWSKSES
ncbi:hypothetical protein [Asticcacaulis sp. YBE204]|uniref:hypothetical protein n=1 Tax=Asticcacaulis sp. YBE204 TaxID=1282363 RepID=UPI0003C3CA07|nr:hypothetical protein [Asticcacaulis sp. YBE204]ESQ79613.1 hypothetical protein AEYBE204_07160 [Asticcacaulis sp. YBE204]